MDGRRTPEDKMAIVNLDHNEANSLGNSELTVTDPLAGYDKLAKQVVGSGITKINGDVIIDDRLFVPFKFRGEFDVRPIFVNDDVVDVIINPTLPGELASVDWRPKSPAFGVKSDLLNVAKGEGKDVELNPEFPSFFGKDNCLGTVTGKLSINFVPPLTNEFPLVQTFRIVEPSAYARTVFIEALKRTGVAINTDLIGPNPSEKLPTENSYTPDTLVAKLVSLPYSEYTRLILKVSYNIGADVSLVLFGLTQGINNIKDALEVERKTLVDNFGIPGDEFHFIDGSGGGESAATTEATVKLLKEMSEREVFTPFFDSLPILGVDGSLSFVTDFEDDPSLASAKGNVRAKTGTFAEGTVQGVLFRAETLAG